MDLKETLRKIVDFKPAFSGIGEVTSIDTKKRTCTIKPANGGAEFKGVRLQAVNALQSGIIIFPKLGSDVIYGLLDDDEAFIQLCSEITEIEIISSVEIRINGDQFGGIVNAKKLKEQIDKNSEILNQILSIINGAPVTEPGNGNPSALQTSLKSVLAGRQTANLSNIENEKVKHG